MRIALSSAALILFGASVARPGPVEIFRDIGGEPVLVSASIISDNVEAWHIRWRAIEEAEVSVDAVCFSLHGDVFGLSFLGLLLEKAERGVTVRLLVDSKSSGFFTTPLGRDYLQELAAHPNIRVKTYNPFVPSLVRAVFTLTCRKMLACSHAKLLLVDGRLAITGGRNIGLEYYADPADHPPAWRDTDAVFRGPGVGAAFQPVFDAEFSYAKNRTVRRDRFGNWDSKRDRLRWACDAMRSWLREGTAVPVSEETIAYQRAIEAWRAGRRGRSLPVAPCAPDMFNREIGRLRRLAGGGRPAGDASPADPEAAVKVLGKESFSAGNRPDEITDNLVRLIDGTEEELVVQNPYIVLTDKVHRAFRRAHDRGVRLVFHTNSPRSTNSLFTQAFFNADWGTYRRDLPRARIYAFTGERKLHAKVFVFDRKVVMVGTYNLDSISETINSEIMAVIRSDALASHAVGQIDGDLRQSVELTAHPEADRTNIPEKYASWWERLWLRVLGRLPLLKGYI